MARLHAHWIEGCPAEVGLYRVVFEIYGEETTHLIRLEAYPPEPGFPVSMMRCFFIDGTDWLPPVGESRILRYLPVGANE
jgi:hypothetical protein